MLREENGDFGAEAYHAQALGSILAIPRLLKMQINSQNTDKK